MFEARLSRYGAPLVCAVTLFFTATTAHADGTSHAAQVLFEEGRRLMAAGELAEACPKFAESQKLDPGAGTLLNLALCYEKSGRLASAWATYTEAAADADRSGRTQWRKRAKDKAAALAPLLSTLTIVVPQASETSGLEIMRDGTTTTRGELGVKVPLDGGEHVILARAPGHDTWSKRVTVPPRGGEITVTVPALARSTSAPEPASVSATTTAPAPAPAVAHDDAPAVAPRAEPETRGGTQRVLGIVTAAVGVVGVGVGGYLSLQAMGKHDDARANCNPDETRCNPRGLGDYQDAVASANGATIAFVVGGALLVGGAILYLTAPRSGSVSSAAGGPKLGPFMSSTGLGATF